MLADWDRWYPNCEPIGHYLRASFKKRWVRFHSLPDSKRYPENDAEYAELLIRHNSVLAALAYPGEKVTLVSAGYSESPAPVRSYPQLTILDPDAVHWRSVAIHLIEQGFAHPNFLHLFVSTREWQPGEFDPIVRLVADDVVDDVLLVAGDCRWVLHPYDGGMDVIVESSAERDRLRNRHAACLPARLDGM